MTTLQAPERLSTERVELDEPTHVYTVGEGITSRRVPSLSSLISASGLGTNYSEVDPEYLMWRALVGTTVHLAILRYMAGFDPFEGVVDDEITKPYGGLVNGSRPHFDAFRRWHDRKKLVTWYAEAPSYNADMDYCCTLDWMGLLDDTPCLIDWKTTSKIGRSVGIQTLGQRRCFAAPDVRRAALWLPKSGEARLVPFVNDYEDYRALRYCAEGRDLRKIFCAA